MRGCAHLQDWDLLLGHRALQPGAQLSKREQQSLFLPKLPLGMRWPVAQCRHCLEPVLVLIALRCYLRELRLSQDYLLRFNDSNVDDSPPTEKKKKKKKELNDV